MLLDNIAKNSNPIKNTALSLFDNVTEKATSWDDYLVDSIGSSLSSRWDNWLIEHPYAAWLVSHPIISLTLGSIALILTIRLIVTIYRAIANTIDRMWLWILRSPYLLLKLLFGWETKTETVTSNTTITNYEVTNNPEQLQEIMARLDTIQQQQEQIMQDLALLKQQPLAIESKKLHLVKKEISSDR